MVHAPDLLENKQGRGYESMPSDGSSASAVNMEENYIGGNVFTREQPCKHDTEQAGERLGSCYWVIESSVQCGGKIPQLETVMCGMRDWLDTSKN